MKIKKSFLVIVVLFSFSIVQTVNDCTDHKSTWLVQPTYKLGSTDIDPTHLDNAYLTGYLKNRSHDHIPFGTQVGKYLGVSGFAKKVLVILWSGYQLRYQYSNMWSQWKNMRYSADSESWHRVLLNGQPNGILGTLTENFNCKYPVWIGPSCPQKSGREKNGPLLAWCSTSKLKMPIYNEYFKDTCNPGDVYVRAESHKDEQCDEMTDSWLIMCSNKTWSSGNQYLGVPVSSGCQGNQRGLLVGDAMQNSGIAYPLLYNNTVLKISPWYTAFASLLTEGSVVASSGSAKGDDVIKPSDFASFNLGSVSATDRSYLQNHFAAALKSFATSVNSGGSITNNSFDYSYSGSYISHMNFVPGSFNGIVITKIYNKTDETFSIRQGGVQIGTLQPGINDVMLYGASSVKGDIVFIPHTPGKGKWRISFKKGSGLKSEIKDASLDLSDLLGDNSEHVCVQITDSDIPDSFTADAPLVKRTQALNLTQFNDPCNISLELADSLVTQKIGGKSYHFVQNSKDDSETKMPMFYPSIKSVQFLKVSQIPFLFLPGSMQLNEQLQTWINFINLINVSISTDYNLFPKKIDQIAVLKAQEAVVVGDKSKHLGDMRLQQKDGISYIISEIFNTPLEIATDIMTIDSQGFGKDQKKIKKHQQKLQQVQTNFTSQVAAKKGKNIPMSGHSGPANDGLKGLAWGDSNLVSSWSDEFNMGNFTDIDQLYVRFYTPEKGGGSGWWDWIVDKKTLASISDDAKQQGLKVMTKFDASSKTIHAYLAGLDGTIYVRGKSTTSGGQPTHYDVVVNGDISISKSIILHPSEKISNIVVIPRGPGGTVAFTESIDVSPVVSFAKLSVSLTGLNVTIDIIDDQGKSIKKVSKKVSFKPTSYVVQVNGGAMPAGGARKNTDEGVWFIGMDQSVYMYSPDIKNAKQMSKQTVYNYDTSSKTVSEQQGLKSVTFTVGKLSGSKVKTSKLSAKKNIKKIVSKPKIVVKGKTPKAKSKIK